MKNFKTIFFFVAMMAIGAFISSCGNASQNQDAAHGEGKEYTSAYVCPMHCKDSGSDAEGKCPVCGMDYVTQGEHVKDGHNH